MIPSHLVLYAQTYYVHHPHAQNLTYANYHAYTDFTPTVFTDPQNGCQNTPLAQYAENQHTNFNYQDY